MTAAFHAPEVGTATRWREAVVGAWAVPAVRAGTLGSCFILVGSLTPAFLPADNAFNHVWLLRELQHGAGRVLATAVLLFGVLILLWAWLRLHPRDDGVDVSRATLALWGLPLCYGVIDFAAHNGLVAFGVSGGLALLWVATGHDRELVHPGDPRRPHRTWPELVHSTAQMSVRRAGSDAVPETLPESSALRGTTSSGPDADLRAPAAPPEATVPVPARGQVRHRATAARHTERSWP